jgi:hypothetical protein
LAPAVPHHRHESARVPVTDARHHNRGCVKEAQQSERPSHGGHGTRRPIRKDPHPAPKPQSRAKSSPGTIVIVVSTGAAKPRSGETCFPSPLPPVSGAPPERSEGWDTAEATTSTADSQSPFGKIRKNLPNHPTQFATLEIDRSPNQRKKQSHGYRPWLFRVRKLFVWTNLAINALE